MGNDIYRLASDSALAPLIYTTLNELDLLGELPADLTERLRTYYHFIAAKNSVALKDLTEFASIINQIPARFMLIKGVALIVGDYYRNPGMRLLSDIDILLEDPELAPEVEKRLLENNYYMDHGADNLPSFFHHDHHLPPFFSERGTMFEVHTHITRLQDKGEWEIWDSAEDVETKNGEEYVIPQAEDLLLVLAINTAAHHSDLLVPMYFKFMADLITILNRKGNKFDWSRFIEVASRLGLTTTATAPLTVASQLLGLEGLKELPEVPQTPFVTSMVAAMKGEIRPPRISWMVTLMGEQKSLLSKLRIALYILFPPREEIGIIYPSLASPALKWLAYLIRPFHLAGKYRFSDFLFAYRAGRDLKVND